MLLSRLSFVKNPVEPSLFEEIKVKLSGNLLSYSSIGSYMIIKTRLAAIAIVLFCIALTLVITLLHMIGASVYVGE